MSVQDAHCSFAAPVAISDPIADKNQDSSYAPIQKSHYPRTAQTTQKPMTKKRAGTVSPAQMLRGWLSCVRLGKLQTARTKKYSRFDFATQSDGFVGAELRVRPFQSATRSRTISIKRARKRVTDFGQLPLVSSSLPTSLLAERKGTQLQRPNQL
jgi:hypothetical protein